MKTIVTALIASVAATGALAQDGPELSTIITESIGYFNLAPGQVIIEGNENQPNRVCAISVSDAAFADVAAGSDPTGLEYNCFSLEETGNNELSAHIDASIGYFNLRPGVFVIEGENGTVVCQLDVLDAFMSARKYDDLEGQANNLPRAVCIDIAQFEG